MNYTDVDGWFSEHDVATYSKLLEKIPDGGTFVELGVCRGRSMCSQAELIKRKNLKVIAVDTFEGTSNEGDVHADAKTTDWRAIFEENISKFGLSSHVEVYRGRTDEVYTKFSPGSFDLIFIDADHSTEAVQKDIELWEPLLNENGILSGHDWTWPSVQKALALRGKDPITEGNIWFTKKVKRSEKPLFSCVFIARNEAKCLPKALASLKEFRDRGGEIVIVDTGSTDDTAKIAREAGCVVEEVGSRFLHRIDAETAKSVNAWFIEGDEEPLLKEGDTIFDFAAARNYCVSLASNDFVSYMDCDELFEKLDIDKLNELIQQGVTQLEYLFQFAPTIHFVQSKAYDRRVMKWNGIIHEVLQGNGQRKFLGREHFYLKHEQNQETNRSGYLRGLALDCFLHPNEDRQSHYFARECMYTGRPKTAIKEFERHIAMKRWPTEASQSLCYLGDCYMRVGREEDGLAAWHRAYDMEGGRREPLMRLAHYYLWKRDFLKATVYAKASLEIPKGDFYANDSNLYEHAPHEILYESLVHLGRKEEAKEHWKKAIGFMPEYPKYVSDAQFFPDMLPKVSILVPQLGRPEGLKRLQSSIDAQIYPKDKIEVIVDDREEPTVPEKVRDMYEKATGEWIMYAANDLELDPFCIIQAVIMAKLQDDTTDYRLIAINDSELLPDGGNKCAHFLIHRSLVDELEGGQIFSTDFTHVGCDNWLVAQVEKKPLKTFVRCERAKAVHHHFSKDSKYDWVYKRGWDHAEEDRETLKKKLATL